MNLMIYNVVVQIQPHPFTIRPHRTLVALSIPVLLSLTAEPVTALVDTAFVASLGSVTLAALGVGTTALTSIFWIFNFLGISTQTEIAQADGRGNMEKASGIASLAMTLALGFGLILIVVLIPSSYWLAELLGATGEVVSKAVSYMQIRLFGAPAVLLMLATFGVLRGMQDMRTPLWIAIIVNALNVVLDWLLIFGYGPIPMMGVAGSALASTISQWLGAIIGVGIVAGRLGLSRSFTFRDVGRMLSVGRDLFVRTGLLTFFLAYTTRAATRIGADAGAAHQVIRQVFGFTGLALDAYAATVQSLVGYFLGREEMNWVKRVVTIGAGWSLWTGIALGVLMWLGRDSVIIVLVPETAVRVFLPAWAASAINQPISALAFLTDGVHWGTGDYRFLRNAMIVAAIVGFGGIWLLDLLAIQSLLWIWIVVGAWVVTRAIFGILRIWPGIGNSVFGSGNR